MSDRRRPTAYYVVFTLLMGTLHTSASMLGGPMSEDDVMKLWNAESANAVTAADLQNANHPANEWLVKLKSSFAGVMEAVCDWEKGVDMKQKVLQSSLIQSLSSSASVRNVQAAELQTFVKDYEQIRSSSGKQICGQSKQFLNGLDVMTVGTTNTAALKEFQYRMGSYVAYIERNLPVKMLQNDLGLWGLDRIDQQDLPYDNTFAPAGDGAGVHVYIIDTGINSAHAEFAGRVEAGYDFVDNNADPEDCNGHGTHCAGTALGATYGVARAATLHGVRVLSCTGSGSYSSVIGGMNWVTENHVRPAVASMSLGAGFSQAINDAIAIATLQPLRPSRSPSPPPPPLMRAPPFPTTAPAPTSSPPAPAS